MSIFGELENAGISVGGPGGTIAFTQPVNFQASLVDRIGIGKVFYVDSVNGATTNDGLAPNRALATIDAAIGKCTAGRGDTIYVLPKHVETIAAATSLVADIADIKIIGLGSGTNRPTLTLTASASTISITAANVTFRNFLLISNYTGGVAVGITVGASAEGCQLIDIEMQETANTKEWLIGISVTAGCDQVLIDGFKYYGIAGGSTTQVIKFVGASDYSIVRNFLIYCDASGAAIDALTAASVWMTIGNGVLHNLDTGAGLSVSVKSDTTGFMHDLRISALKNAVTPAGAAMAISEVYVSNVIFTQGFYQPGQDS